MLDMNFVKLFLARFNIPYPCYILLKSSQESDFRLLESFDGSRAITISEIPVFDHDCIIKDSSTTHHFLWLRFPEQVYVVVAFLKSIPLDYYTINILYHLLYPASQGTSPLKLENRFESIVSSMVELSSTFDFDILINKILEKTLSIVNGDAGLLWVLDSKINKLVCKAYKGSATELTLSLRLELGEGLIGKAILRGAPKLYASYREMLPDIDDFSPSNKAAMSKIFGDRQMDCAFLMPIFVNKQIECIMIVYRAMGNPPFSPSDVEIMTIFADIIEMTMTNAKSLIALQTQLDNLKKCNQVYSKLTSLSIDNSGISTIVKELRKVLSIPVIVINLLANEQYPKTVAFDRELFIKLTESNTIHGDTFYIGSAHDPEQYCVYPVLVGSSCLGYLIVGSKGNESQINNMIIEIGRMVIALELSKAQSTLDIFFKRTAQNFFELINPKSTLDLTKKCSELGMDLSANYAVVVFALPKGNEDLQAPFVYRLISNIRSELASTQKIVFGFQERIVVLLSTKSETGIHQVRQKINAMIAQAHLNGNPSLCAGMGSLYEGASNISKTYREAQDALTYQLSRHCAGLLQYSEMGVNQLFINLTTEEATAFLTKVFGPLRGKAKQAEYLEVTLIAYVESNYSMIQTANKLYIHTNTLYQRLKKIETSLNISLKKPDDLLQIQLACYLKNLYPDIYNSL